MLIIISSAKILNLKPQSITLKYTQPEYLKQSEVLIHELRKLKIQDLGQMLDINPQLAQLNHQRHLLWNLPFNTTNAKQTLLTYNGEVFRGINAKNFKEKEILYAQDHLRILSGLYGVLRPLDLMQAYRLEMGSELDTKKGENLYQFWGDLITDSLNKTIKKNNIKTLVNLASNEYYKSINSKKIKANIVTPVFYQIRGGEKKMIVIYTKKARGMMTSFIIKNRIENPQELIHFDMEGYKFDQGSSDEKTMTFVR